MTWQKRSGCAQKIENMLLQEEMTLLLANYYLGCEYTLLLPHV